MNKIVAIDNKGRICRKCETFKPWDKFDRKSDGLNGRHSQCKLCIGKFKRKWWKKKNIKKIIRPTILDFSNSDISEKTISFTKSEKSEFEKILRSMVFNSFCVSKRKV